MKLIKRFAQITLAVAILGAIVTFTAMMVKDYSRQVAEVPDTQKATLPLTK